MSIYWNKYYGYDEKYPDDDNYRAISGIFFNRNFTLIIVWSKLHFHLSVTKNTATPAIIFNESTNILILPNLFFLNKLNPLLCL